MSGGPVYDTNRLRVLREVSLRGSLAAAAEALGHDPSTVSHQLRRLEREVGVPLTEPFGRGVRLTEQAHILVRHTETVLGALEAAQAEIAASREGVRGTVRVACFQTAAHTVVPVALGRLRNQHPDLRVEVAHLSVERAMPALLARDFDVVMQEGFPGGPVVQPAGASVTVVGDDPLHVVVPPGTAYASLADLADHDWVLEPPGTPARDWARSVCRAAGFEPRVAYETTDVLLHVRLVREGLAALVPGLGLAAAEAGDVDAYPLPGVARRLTLAVRRGSGRGPGIEAVVRALGKAVGEAVVDP